MAEIGDNHNSQGDAGANNNVRPGPPPERDANVLDSTTLKNLSENEREKLLENIGYLFGMCVERIDGPIRSNYPVAKHQLAELPCVREKNGVITEMVTAKTERNANYVHQGWSLDAASVTSPWISSRISRRNQANEDGVWVTKRTIAQRLSFRILLENLIPEPGFKAEIEAALEKSTTYEKFQAVYRALHTWGDVVPLAFDVGLSLAFTDTEANLAELPSVGAYGNVGDLLAIKTAHISRQGGDVINDDWIDPKFLSATVPPLQWCTVRIISVAPTTDLLEDSLKERLFDLYNQRLSYFPLLTMGPTAGAIVGNDHENTSKTISGMIIRVRWYFDSITLKYLDGTTSSRHGSQREVEAPYSFTLATGEHITELMIWSDKAWVYGLQFITNFGRASWHYGGPNGTPSVARSRGGILVGFSTRFSWFDFHKSHLMSEIEGIWRHDLLKNIPREEDIFSSYFGGTSGIPFNDRTLVRNSNSMKISRVDVGCGNVIDSIQFTYAQEELGNRVESKTSRHGGEGGVKKCFILESGERIVTISGKHKDGYIIQLCFATNTGRTSDIFCGGQGSDFSVSAPQDTQGRRMCLHYICGKSDEFLVGLMFVWTPMTP